MIYLITGTPGAGKSLYAVSTLLKKISTDSITGEDGKVSVRRLLVDGIPDLLLPHIPLSGLNALGAYPDDQGSRLGNWFEWCKPGDIICIDEVQRYWRPRALGTKIPADIAALETHRHRGVDFVLITQSAMLLDQNVRRLVGRHIHVRRAFGGARAVLYDWDGCQTDTSRSRGASISYWAYPKDGYKLYKSSELHTKQAQKLPLWVYFPVLVLLLGIFAGPQAYSAMSGALTGKGVVSAKKSAGPGAGSPASASASAPSVSASAPVAAAGGTPLEVPLSAVALEDRPMTGCIASSSRCECYGLDGARVLGLSRDTCLIAAHRVGSISVKAPQLPM